MMKVIFRIFLVVIFGALVFEVKKNHGAQKETSYKTSEAFLIKNGNYYVVFWRSQNKFQSSNFYSLHEAFDFSEKILRVKPSSSLAGSDVERVWLEERNGQSILYWKLFSQRFLNRLSFFNKIEAQKFMVAFRHGSYTPSPFGHSILLRSF